MGRGDMILIIMGRLIEQVWREHRLKKSLLLQDYLFSLLKALPTHICHDEI
jgi:hypothetical protein